MEVELGLAPLSDMLLPPLDEELDLDLLGGDFLSLLQGGEGVCAGLGDLEGPQHLPNNPLYSLHAPPPCHQATAVVPCASPTPSVDTAPASPQPCEAAPPAGLLPVAQQQVLPSGPLNACRNSALRLVTTQAPLLHGSASNNSMFGCPQLSVQQRSSKGPYCSGDRPSCSQDYDEDDSEDSEDTDQGLANPCGGAIAGAGAGPKHNKRKAPEVDWKSIEDPAERRRQRRLAKNRVTAARSRERKKLQWADMEAKIQAIETENSQLRSVLEQFARENSLLKEQLMQLTRPGGAKRMNLSLGKGSTTTEPAALVLIATLLVLCCFLPADKAMMLGSALPLLVLSQLQQLMQQGVDGSELFEALLRLVACIQRLIAKSSLGFRRYVHCLLFKRHHFCGCKAMQDIGDASMLFAAQSLALCKYESVDELMLDPKVVDVAPCSGMVPLAPLPYVPAPVPQASYGSSSGFFGAAFADVVIKAEVVF